ncbi:hypothetical protein AB6A40_010831 [Gnathostoma spinigerum]|uniref:Uncharacterized protein n=1 Tax=Gnathostoma spinigerum TaxID=75299 RepID=A0ABD6F356_9BILA
MPNSHKKEDGYNALRDMICKFGSETSSSSPTNLYLSLTKEVSSKRTTSTTLFPCSLENAEVCLQLVLSCLSGPVLSCTFSASSNVLVRNKQFIMETATIPHH